jgi:asparagine synthetase B (glutamine-hydrolysing)
MNRAYIKSLSFEELKELAAVVNNELYLKNPENIAQREREDKFYAAQRAKDAEKKRINELMHARLKKILTPGMRLKLKGCKDGAGLREFIRWDGEHLVCWKIRRRHIIGADRKAMVKDENTNIVTTHMPDKVVKVFAPTAELSAATIRTTPPSILASFIEKVLPA